MLFCLHQLFNLLFISLCYLLIISLLTWNLYTQILYTTLLERTTIATSGCYRIFVCKVRPEFIPETLGYVLGITVSLAICTIILCFIEDYLCGINYKLFEMGVKKYVYNNYICHNIYNQYFVIWIC